MSTEPRTAWRERAALEGLKVRLRDALRAVEFALTPEIREGPAIVELVTLSNLPIAQARFDGAEPFLLLGGIERSVDELEAIGAWCERVTWLARAHRRQQEDAERETE